jgi:Aminoglycoside/hydroxyurea antibiotic resistance kinase
VSQCRSHPRRGWVPSLTRSIRCPQYCRGQGQKRSDFAQGSARRGCGGRRAGRARHRTRRGRCPARCSGWLRGFAAGRASERSPSASARCASCNAAGLRAWEGNGAVRLHAACDSESAYGLLLERRVPGTALAEALPEPGQDVVVAGLPRRLWARPAGGYPFRPLAQMCHAWADEFEAEYATAPPADGSTRAWRGKGSPCSASCRAPLPARRCCAPTCTLTTSWPRSASPGW